eukprot:COSAG06_NODE_6763_length_2793_cov_9.335932_5_plen_180_part_00
MSYQQCCCCQRPPAAAGWTLRGVRHSWRTVHVGAQTLLRLGHGGCSWRRRLSPWRWAHPWSHKAATTVAPRLQQIIFGSALLRTPHPVLYCCCCVLLLLLLLLLLASGGNISSASTGLGAEFCTRVQNSARIASPRRPATPRPCCQPAAHSHASSARQGSRATPLRACRASRVAGGPSR